MSKAVHWPQVVGLENKEIDPPLVYGYDISLYLPEGCPTRADVIDRAMRIGYALGVMAGQGQDITQLPQQKLPNPLYDSIMEGKQ